MLPTSRSSRSGWLPVPPRARLSSDPPFEPMSTPITTLISASFPASLRLSRLNQIFAVQSQSLPIMNTSVSLADRPLSSWADSVCSDSLPALRTSSCLPRAPLGPGPSISHTVTSGLRARSTSCCLSSVASTASCWTSSYQTWRPIGLRTLRCVFATWWALPKSRSSINPSMETIFPSGTTLSSM